MGEKISETGFVEEELLPENSSFWKIAGFNLKRSLRWMTSPPARKGALIGLAVGVSIAIPMWTVTVLTNGDINIWIQAVKNPAFVGYLGVSTAIIVGIPAMIGDAIGAGIAESQEISS